MANSDAALFCRASFGTFEAGEAFYLAACAMCYLYTFQKPRNYPLCVSDDFKHLVFYSSNATAKSLLANADDLQSQIYTSGFPAEDDSGRNSTTLNDHHSGQIWRKCCSAARDCCNKIAFTRDDFSSSTDGRNASYCPATWDGWSCWPQTPSNSTTFGSCPPYMTTNGEVCSGLASKVCLDGHWFRRAGTRDSGCDSTLYNNNNDYDAVDSSDDYSREFTNYEHCQPVKVVLLDQYWLATFVSYGLSIAAVTPALLIFIAFRQLRSSTRVRLHICLLLTILITAMLALWNQHFVVPTSTQMLARIAQQRSSPHVPLETVSDFSLLSDNKNVLATSLNDDLYWHSILLCRLGFILLQYSRLSCLTWTLCEAVRLTRVISTSLVVACQADDESLLPYIVTGWMLPAVPVIIFFLLKYSNDQLITGGGKFNTADSDVCWVNPEGAKYWIFVAPSLLILSLNAYCLARIMVEVVRKLRATQTNERTQLRKAARATTILILVFGHHSLATAFRPEPTCRSASYLIANEYLFGLQGLTVSVVLCYWNAEVGMLVRTRFRMVRRDCVYRCCPSRHHYSSRSASTATTAGSGSGSVRTTPARKQQQQQCRAQSLPKSLMLSTNGVSSHELQMIVSRREVRSISYCSNGWTASQPRKDGWV